jgi:hypothetical protein
VVDAPADGRVTGTSTAAITVTTAADTAADLEIFTIPPGRSRWG